MNLIVSTLHSHHHLEWNHPDNFADTGNCITKNAALCPINGYTLQGNTSPVLDAEQHFNCYSIVVKFDENSAPTNQYFPVLGRSPPAVV
jgi:hypothetical protein